MTEIPDMAGAPCLTAASPPSEPDGQDEALLELLRYLKGKAYRFTSVTPATHERVLARPATGPASLTGIFGWNRAFDAGDLDAELFGLLRDKAVLAPSGGGWRSQVRVSSLGSDLFLHSGFPTKEHDAVFFGPDTYRFARFIEHELGPLAPVARIVDMGTGSGAGGLFCARLSPASRVTLVDVNDKALRYARLNAAAAGLEAELHRGGRVPPGADLIVANPPYMIDAAGREYRDGGGLLGGEVALDWVRQSLAALAPGGRMLLYSGVAMVEGRSPALDAIEAESARAGARLSSYEIDPDVFGEELSSPGYSQVERIAAVGCVLALPG